MRRLGILLLALFLCLTGCHKREENSQENTEEKLSPTGVMVPTADISSVQMNASDVETECLLGDSFFYGKRSFEKDGEGNKRASITFCRRDFADFEKEQILLRQEEGSTVRRMTLDAEANLYELFFEEGEGDRIYYIGKWNREGEQVYAQAVTELPSGRLDEAAGAVADKEGRLCLYTWDGALYAFDENGSFTGQSETNMALAENGSFVRAVGDVYWYQDMGAYVDLYRLDMENIMLRKQASVSLDAADMGNVSLQGTSEGVLLATQRGLYGCDMQTGDKEELLLWQNPYINLEGKHLRLLGDAEPGKLRLLFQEIDIHGYTIDESALISEKDKGLLPQKETVTLGTMSVGTADLSDWVRQFNRQSDKYFIETVFYFPSDEQGELMGNVHMDILQGTAPDLIDIGGMDLMTLADKGIFEDLEPYLKDSDVVKKKDILESVWQEGQLGGKLRMIFPVFGVETYVTHNAGKEPGWTLEEYVQYAGEYPDTPLLQRMRYHSALRVALFAGMDEFVDYEKGTCDFTDEEFVKLLEGVRDMNLQQVLDKDSYDWDEAHRAFREGEMLMHEVSFGSMEEFLELKKQYGEDFGWQGYPSADGSPCHEMNPEFCLVMNSASENKEGAWAFLEFLWSEENQERERAWASFPVRRDTFENYIEAGAEEEPATDRDKEQIMEMIRASRTDKLGIDDDAFRIICEEAEAFFAGDKTAQETAEIIQNRVSLYLKEKRN